jgi:hypothetical protein
VINHQKSAYCAGKGNLRAAMAKQSTELRDEEEEEEEEEEHKTV